MEDHPMATSNLQKPLILVPHQIAPNLTCRDIYMENDVKQVISI